MAEGGDTLNESFDLSVAPIPAPSRTNEDGDVVGGLHGGWRLCRAVSP